MNSDQFKRILELTDIGPEYVSVPTIENLDYICKKMLVSFHYSTLQIQDDSAGSTKLNWSIIYDRLVEKRRGGLCYERNELLFQFIKFIGYEPHRIEARLFESNGQLTPRHGHYSTTINYILDNTKFQDHMAVVVRMMNNDKQQSYLCDCGWGGIW